MTAHDDWPAGDRPDDDRQRLALVDDRYRIARDLHDHVIQNLFAVGLSLQRVLATLPEGEAAERLSDQIDAIDATIRQIRTTIFELTTAAVTRDARSAVTDLAHSAVDGTGIALHLDLGDAVELLGELTPDVLAVVREALSNVVRHAAAQSATVAIRERGHDLAVVVTDDGASGSLEPTGRGLRNLESRAVARGGSFTIVSGVGTSGGRRGTRLEWSVPLR